MPIAHFEVSDAVTNGGRLQEQRLNLRLLIPVLLVSVLFIGVLFWARQGSSSDDIRQEASDPHDQLPYSIIWMRHGESTSNIVTYFAQDVCSVPPSTDRVKRCKNDYATNAAITHLGEAHARQAVLDNHKLFFGDGGVADADGPIKGRIYCSYLRRAIQTAAILAAELARVRPENSFQIIPLPYIQESNGGCKPRQGCNDQTRWDKVNGTMIEWNESTIRRQIQDVVGELPPQVILNASYVFRSDEVQSSDRSEKSMSVLEPRVHQFQEFVLTRGLLAQRSMFIVSHGDFIRALSCFNQPSCLLNESNFWNNAAVARCEYTKELKLQGAQALYDGNARLRRDKINAENKSESLLTKTGGLQNWTMDDLSKMKDINHSSAVLACISNDGSC